VNIDKITNCEDLLAGNAVFTVISGEERYTYHFYAPTHGKNKGKVLARLLTGPSNTHDYNDLGIIDPTTGNIELSGMYAIRDGKVLVPAALARWIAKMAVSKSAVPSGIEIIGSGHCLCCRRLLTVPYPDNPFRLRSLGPICGGK
jgi:hypothetical protein